MGVNTLLFAGLSPEITTKNKGDHVISFGEIGIDSTRLEDDENGKKVWDYLQDKIKLYVR